MRDISSPFRVFWQAFRLWLDEPATNIIINLVWLISWLTIVLGPPVTFSMIDATRTLADGYYPTRTEFLEATRRYFVKSWQWMLANLAMLMLFGINLVFYGRLEVSWGIYVQGFFLGLLLLWLGTQFYALPYLIIQEEKSLRTAWKNGLFTFLAAPVYSVILGILALVVILLSIYAAFLPAFLGTGTLLATLANVAITERLQKFGVSDDQSEKPDGDGGK